LLVITRGVEISVFLITTVFTKEIFSLPIGFENETALTTSLTSVSRRITNKKNLFCFATPFHFVLDEFVSPVAHISTRLILVSYVSDIFEINSVDVTKVKLVNRPVDKVLSMILGLLESSRTLLSSGESLRNSPERVTVTVFFRSRLPITQRQNGSQTLIGTSDSLGFSLGFLSKLPSKINKLLSKKKTIHNFTTLLHLVGVSMKLDGKNTRDTFTPVIERLDFQPARKVTSSDFSKITTEGTDFGINVRNVGFCGFIMSQGFPKFSRNFLLLGSPVVGNELPFSLFLSRGFNNGKNLRHTRRFGSCRQPGVKISRDINICSRKHTGTVESGVSIESKSKPRSSDVDTVLPKIIKIDFRDPSVFVNKVRNNPCFSSIGLRKRVA